MSESIIFPGDRIASIEEYEAGHNTFDDGNDVRATVVGTVEIDKKERIIHVKHSGVISIPKVGDIVTGKVTAVFGAMIAVSIDYINGKPKSSHVECICSTRNLRKKRIALVKKVIQMRDAVKCTECSWIDERKLSSDFGTNYFVKLSEK